MVAMGALSGCGPIKALLFPPSDMVFKPKPEASASPEVSTDGAESGADLPLYTYETESAKYTVGSKINANKPKAVKDQIFVGYQTQSELPKGLVLDLLTGEISGTPEERFPVARIYVLAAREDLTTEKYQVDIEIVDQAPTQCSLENPIISAKKGDAIEEITVSKVGKVERYSVSPELPSGISLNAQTGKISGVALLKSKRSTYKIECSNSGGSASSQFEIEIKDLPPSSFTYAAQVLTYNLSMTSVAPVKESNGGDVIRYELIQSLPQGLSLDSVTGAISGTPAIPQSRVAYSVKAIGEEGTAQADIEIEIKDQAPRNLSYPLNSLSLREGTPINAQSPMFEGAYRAQYKSVPALPEGLSLNVQTGVISGTPEIAPYQGTHQITAYNDEGQSTFSIAITIVEIAPANLSYGAEQFVLEKRTSKILSPSQSGGKISRYEVSPSLPSGISLDPSTGVISGKPTAIALTQTFVVTGSNTGGSTQTEFSLRVDGSRQEKLAVGALHSCAIKAGALYCFGDASTGQLSQYVVAGQSLRPLKVPFGGAVQAVASGSDHVCFISEGLLYCFGSSVEGQAGVDAAVVAGSTKVLGLPGAAEEVSAKGNSTCILSQNRVFCMGAVVGGRATATEVQFQGVPQGKISQIATGFDHVCALVETVAGSTAACYGQDVFSQLALAGSEVKNLSAGQSLTCGLSAAGMLECVGANERGQLGGGFVSNYESAPVSVVATDPTVWSELSAGSGHVCFVSQGLAYCFGDGFFGQLGDGSKFQISPVPVKVQDPAQRLANSQWSAMQAGETHTCGWYGDELYCFGLNSRGQLGTGDSVQKTAPVLVSF